MPLNAIKNYVKEELPGIYEAGKFIRNRAEDFNENREQVIEGRIQELEGEDSTQINEEVRPIGSEAVLNGQPVFWSGQNYGWQSKGSFDKLMDEGQFRMGGIAAQRFGNSITEAIPQEVKDFATEKITDATTAAVDWYDSQSYENKRRYINPTLNIANGVVTLADQGLEFISEKTNTSRFITDELVMAAFTAGGSAAIRRATPAIKQGAKTAIKAIDKYGPTIDDIFPPTPPVALATAGVSPSFPTLRPNYDGASVNLAPQVMMAKATSKMTQAEWDTQRGAEIRIQRTNAEAAKTAMENIEANNPGVPKSVLKAKNMGGYINEQGKYKDGYATQLGRYNDGLEKINRAESNIKVPTFDNEYAYPRDALGAKQFKEEVRIANEALGRATEQLELHHLIPKGMSAAIYNRARDFIEDGLVDAQYLNRIAEKFKKITGADTGDLKSGILPMGQTGHRTYHPEMRAQPSLTFPGESMEIMKETLTTKLNKITNPKDFEILLDKLIKNDIKPLVDNARIWEKMDDFLIKESRNYTATAKTNAALKKIKTQVESKRQRQKKTNK